MSILRSFVAVCCSFYKYCCLVWLFALLFWLLFKKTGKINYEGAPPLHVQSFPRVCCNLKPIWRSQKLYLGTTMIKQRSKQLFFRPHSTIPRTNTEPRRDVLHTKVHSMIFTYIPTDIVSAQAVTVAETCINICHATYSKCSSQYSYASRESRRQGNRAVRDLKL